jgi:GTPase Era involved in 16S rRNA processing
VLHDVGNKWTRGSLNPALLRLLHLYPNKESILVLNKIDIIKEKRLLLKLTSQLTEGMIDGQAIITTPTPSKLRWPGKKPVTNGQAVVTPVVQHLSSNLTEQQVGEEIKGKIGWPRFKRVFMISALDGDGVSDIMVYILTFSKPYIE